MTVVSEMHQRLFSGYIKAKLKMAVSLLRRGILAPDMDWYDTPQPTGKVLIIVFLISLYELQCFDNFCFQKFVHTCLRR